jgi:hypothetical protein
MLETHARAPEQPPEPGVVVGGGGDGDAVVVGVLVVLGPLPPFVIIFLMAASYRSLATKNSLH